MTITSAHLRRVFAGGNKNIFALRAGDVGEGNSNLPTLKVVVGLVRGNNNLLLPREVGSRGSDNVFPPREVGLARGGKQPFPT